MPLPAAPLRQATTVFLLCDVQDRFAPVITHWTGVIAATKRLLAGAKALGVPTIATEQNPARLGKTYGELDISDVEVYEKTMFSMCTAQVMQRLEELKPRSIVLFGVETHVCVLQTAINLLERNYSVYIVADACSSRFNADRHIALETMRQFGAIVTTSESVLFQLLGDSNNKAFKAISNIVKPVPPETGLLSMRLDKADESKL